MAQTDNNIRVTMVDELTHGVPEPALHQRWDSEVDRRWPIMTEQRIPEGEEWRYQALFPDIFLSPRFRDALRTMEVYGITPPSRP